MKELSSDHQSEVGERIRRARKAMGVTQVQFAGRLDISSQNLARLETGRAVLAQELCERIADELGVKSSWISTGRGPDPDHSVRRSKAMSGAQIRHLRESLKMSREELAGRLGIKPSTLHNVELGHQRMGPAATAALRNLASPQNQNRDAAEFQVSQERLVETVINETYRILTDETAMRAIESLGATMGQDELTIVSNLEKRKVFAPS
jgi:transcriptional regulator with XRE-family HTH domain